MQNGNFYAICFIVIATIVADLVVYAVLIEKKRLLKNKIAKSRKVSILSELPSGIFHKMKFEVWEETDKKTSARTLIPENHPQKKLILGKKAKKVDIIKASSYDEAKVIYDRKYNKK